jgi:hypothetical protein
LVGLNPLEALMKRTGLTSLSVIVLLLVSFPSRAIELMPHQAVYRMSLAGADSNSGISGADGAMMYKFEESCDAWTSETNVYLKLAYTEGEVMETTWSFVSWEAKDGLGYRFRVRQSRDGTLVEKIQGTVSRDQIDSPARAEFSSPEGTVIELPEGTMFPTRHLSALIREGEKGTLIYSRTVFDGASLDNPYNINALITSRSAKKKAKLDKNAFKHVRMAFFPIDSRKEFPEFELGIDYRANGIADHILQDFGDFTLNLAADKIEMLERPGC